MIYVIKFTPIVLFKVLCDLYLGSVSFQLLMHVYRTMLAKSFLTSAARTMTRGLATSGARRGGDTMVLHKDTPENNADTPFQFTAENKARADAIMSIYPDGHQRAAVRTFITFT